MPTPRIRTETAARAQPSRVFGTIWGNPRPGRAPTSSCPTPACSRPACCAAVRSRTAGHRSTVSGTPDSAQPRRAFSSLLLWLATVVASFRSVLREGRDRLPAQSRAQKHPEPPARGVQTPLDGACRGVHAAGHLGLAHAEVVSLDYRGPLGRRQLRERGPDAPPFFGLFEMLGGPRAGIFEQLGGVHVFVVGHSFPAGG